jgi:hypothetical protein
MAQAPDQGLHLKGHGLGRLAHQVLGLRGDRFVCTGPSGTPQQHCRHAQPSWYVFHVYGASVKVWKKLETLDGTYFDCGFNLSGYAMVTEGGRPFGHRQPCLVTRQRRRHQTVIRTK